MTIKPENTALASNMNDRLAASGNLYRGNLIGGDGSGITYVTPDENLRIAGETQSAPDVMGLQYENGSLVAVHRVDLYSPEVSKGADSLRKAIEKKINGRQADHTVVQAADEEQAQQIAAGSYAYRDGTLAEIQPLGDGMFLIGRGPVSCCPRPGCCRVAGWQKSRRAGCRGPGDPSAAGSGGSAHDGVAGGRNPGMSQIWRLVRELPGRIAG